MATYRKFVRDDLDECTDLFLDVFSRPPWSDEWPSRDRAKAYLSDIMGMPGFRGFLAIDDGRICGMCFGRIKQWWKGDEYFLEEACISAAFQGRGIGSGMITYAIEEMKKEGIVYALALTEKGIPAEKFYLRNGFLASERMVLMHLRL